MRKLILTILILTNWATFSTGQNLVPNPSFEIYTSCPTASGQINYATPWVGTNNSTDYLNACAPPYSLSVPCQTGISFQYAKTGNAFAGLWMTDGFAPYREYLQVMLLDTLINSQCYFVRYYVNLHNQIKYAVNNFGTYFSNASFTTPTWGLPSYVPQLLGFNNLIINDTLNWVPIEGIYIANGGEKYITLGNFFDDAHTDTLDTGDGTYVGAYYYFDDVSVIPIDSIMGGMPANAGNDTSVVSGDSVFVGQQITGLNCNWYNSTGTLIASNISGIYVHPTTNTFYTVEQNLCSTITYDTVNVNVTYVGINENYLKSKVKLYPNPFTNVATLQFDNPTKQNCTLTVYDFRGQVVRTIKNIMVDNVEIERQSLASGLYFFQLHTDRQIIATGKLTIE